MCVHCQAAELLKSPMLTDDTVSRHRWSRLRNVRFVGVNTFSRYDWSSPGGGTDLLVIQFAFLSGHVCVRVVDQSLICIATHHPMSHLISKDAA